MVSVSNHERRWDAVLLLLALIFLAFHLPYLPKSLEDLDSINFALGLRRFDVAAHQPHPPGYPIYILVGKGVRAIVGSELAALGVMSIVAGTLGVFAIAALARRISDGNGDRWSIAACVLAIASPLYWFTAARPLSDMPGLAAAIAVQVLTLAATSPRMLAVAAFAGGLAMGLRSQIVWLTFPLLLYVASGVSRTTERGRRVRLLLTAMAAFAAGVVVWAVPLVALTGGPRAYGAAVAFQGSADLGDIQMLWTRHGARDVADALYYAFVAPWATWPIAVSVLVLAIVGLAALLRRSRQSGVVLAAAFGPYFVFDLLFQETFTSRYALPLVVPVAILAASGARALPFRVGAVAVAAIAILGAHNGGTSVAAFAREKAPAFRLIDDMRRSGEATPKPPVLAMDRRQAFDFRRPIVWADGELPRFEQVLPAPPQHEWLEPVKYWTGGGRAPVWFVVDPKRTMVQLVQHGDPQRYRWSLPHPVLVGGARPDEMDFYRVDAPDWFVGEGWALTPEAAGIAEADRRGPSLAPVDAWISRRVAGGALMLGGRNFSSGPATITVEADGAQPPPAPFTAPAGAFINFLPLTSLQPTTDYVHLRIQAPPNTNVAFEQFDAASTRPIFGYANGWHEPEFNPRTGQRWRWLSERGEIRFASPAPRSTLRIAGESPRRYFSKGSHLLVRSGDRVVFDDVLTSDFSLDIPLPDGTEIVSLETDQVFQPADRSRRSADRRHLGLRIFSCDLRPVS
jgi:Dolichyl-phosphate-mannose-protein mannosyltransferase